MNNSFFYEQMKKCVEEFYNIYNLDDYISKSKYESFLDKYKDIFAMIGKYDDKENELYKKMIIMAQNGYDIIYSKNISYINKHLTVDKEYFDNLFLDIDSKILLDEEQRKAILCDEDYSLVIAGAGSGKTTTMAAKVKYLIEKKHVNPKEIILLSFTNKATEELKSNNEFNYKYVIIDEYQDISKQRYNFAKRLSDLFKAKIVAVGDDYQTIFSFSGSDIELFTKFYENVGYASIMEITKTYRNSQELIDVAGEFIQKNKFQLYKRLVSDKHLYKPVELVEYEYSKDSNKLPEMLNNLLIELYSKNPHSKVLLLCRFKSEIYSLTDSKLFYIANKKEGKIICKKCPNLSIDIMTIHNSKGLGYDQVILLNALNIHMGFPSQIEDETIIKYIKGTNNLDENIIEYPEERRLFYVAMTRTKNKLYIMIPNKYEYKSDFIKEIENDKNVMIRYYRSDLNEKIPTWLYRRNWL